MEAGLPWVPEGLISRAVAGAGTGLPSLREKNRPHCRAPLQGRLYSVEPTEDSRVD